MKTGAIIEPTVDAVAASIATEIVLKAGQRATVSVDAGIGAEDIEIKRRVGDVYLSMADSQDTINTGAKVVNAANSDRQITGPIVVAIDKPTTASATGVYLSKF